MVDFRAGDEAELQAVVVRLGLSHKTIHAAVLLERGSLQGLPIRLRCKKS